MYVGRGSHWNHGVGGGWCNPAYINCIVDFHQFSGIFVELWHHNATLEFYFCISGKRTHQSFHWYQINSLFVTATNKNALKMVKNSYFCQFSSIFSVFVEWWRHYDVIMQWYHFILAFLDRAHIKLYSDTKQPHYLPIINKTQGGVATTPPPWCGVLQKTPW